MSLPEFAKYTCNESKYSSKNISDGEFLLVIREDVSYSNFLPFIYINSCKDEDIWAIDDEITRISLSQGSGNRNEYIYSPAINELVILLGKINENSDNRYSHWCYSNQIRNIAEYNDGDFIKDIFIGNINSSSKTVHFQEEMPELYERYIETTRDFYILDGINVIGPFFIENIIENNRYKINNSSKDVVSAIVKEDLILRPSRALTNGHERIFIFKSQLISLIEDATFIDFISDIELVSWAKQQLEKDSIETHTAEGVKTLYRLINNPSLSKFKERYSRLYSIWNTLSKYSI